ncbi:MAG: hypothetical protein DRJ01_17055 [Bacteroidetes bacterium]|nr:MAG: hypothetical protein DRJ01_17055 [Bacteroidota bacterium]
MIIKHFTIPVFIPGVACPHQCIFCDQKKISGRQKLPSAEKIKNIIEEHLKTISKENTLVEVGFFGGTFTGLSLKKQEEFLKAVAPFIDKGFVKSIRLSTRPDFINDEILELLKNNHVETIELGAQSLHDDILLACERGHTLDDVVKASKMVLDYGFHLGLQMMIGLPGDTLEKTKQTAEKIVELGADNTRIYPTLVVKGTKLEELFNNGDYTALPLDKAVKWTKELFNVFEKNNVNIIRVGLHPSEGLLNGDDLIAGPFHQSFRELVLTEIWNDLLLPLIKKYKDCEKIIINVPEKEYNYAIGYNAKNKKMFEKYFKKVSFKRDKSLKNRTYYADCC